jgi:hypothetical protein
LGTCGLLLVCATLGYATVALLYAHRPISWALLLGLITLLGACECGLLLFYLDLAGLRPGRGALAVIFAAALIALAIAVPLGRWRPKVALSTAPDPWVNRALLLFPVALATYALYVVAIETLRRPLVRWDTWAFWLFKAKILANEPLIPAPAFFTAPAYAYAHAHYPLLWPILAAAAYGASFTWDDHLARVILLPLFAAFGLMIYAALRPNLARFQAAMLASLQLALPNVLFHAGLGIADVMLAGYYAAMICCILLDNEQRNWPMLIAAALLAAGCAFTKTEGLPLAAIGAVMTFLLTARRGLGSALGRTALFCAIPVLLLAPWFWWSHPLPRLDENYGARFSLTVIHDNVGRIPVVLRAVGAEMIAPNDWGPLWIILPIFALLGWRGFRRPFICVLWLALLAQLLLYMLAYVVARADLAWLLQTSLDRLLIHITPIAILLIGFHWQIMTRRPAPGAQPTALE